MRLKHKQLEEVIFGRTGFRRFTQDSPILPDVWMAYGDQPSSSSDLLLTPIWGQSPGQLSKTLAERLAAERATPRWKSLSRGRKSLDPEIAYNVSTVAVRLYFDEMIRVLLPMTKWWDKYVAGGEGGKFLAKLLKTNTYRQKLATALGAAASATVEAAPRHGVWDANRASRNEVWGKSQPKLPEHLIWLIRLAGTISLAGQNPPEKIFDDAPALVEAFADLVRNTPQVGADEGAMVWSINLNRKASAMIWRSTGAVKADAARNLFKVKCDGIRWAVIDSGIDATHPAFRLRQPNDKLAPKPFVKKDGAWQNMTRVEKTYDFTPIRKILSLGDEGLKSLPAKLRKRFDGPDRAKEKKSLKERLEQGRAVDWDTLAPFLEVLPDDYDPPAFEHGTHVAGILAADWRYGDEGNDGNLAVDEGSGAKINVQGICPDLRLYDMRVLDENGESDEFSILAAMQFIQYLNANSDHPLLHGVNMSLSIRHKVRNFACGCTPVCEESERLVKAGIVAVAAAGNDGYLDAETAGGANFVEGYRSISITDPGNAPGVITVGATHRDSPHTYGVSYFSSRGPTGDGRIKPDLVAPGEKITSTVPDGGIKSLDGTSMAAPHVSGAAALLMARHRELIGKPGRIKQILCETATDLGRERYFQGSGMVDILRAMQSV